MSNKNLNTIERIERLIFILMSVYAFNSDSNTIERIESLDRSSLWKLDLQVSNTIERIERQNITVFIGLYNVTGENTIERIERLEVT